MRRLNSIQNVDDMLVGVYYDESKGAFHICSRRKVVENPNFKIVFSTHPNIADSFVRWASKENNLANQPDKSIDYIGDKPPKSKIDSDWHLFKSVYKSITIK